MANEQGVRAIEGVSRRYETPVEKVTLTYGQFNRVAAESATIAGFNFINPFENYGFNNITANLDPLAEGNGGLNRHVKYDNEGNIAKSTAMWMG